MVPNLRDVPSDGYKLASSGALTKAETWFLARLREAPDDAHATYALAIVRLSMGRYAEALVGYELRHLMAGAPLPSVPWPAWQGEDLTGRRLVVFPEQGLGDAVQFARFAIRLQAAGADVTLLSPPPLVRLLDGHGVRVVAAAGAAEFPEPDFWIRANSLLRCAGPTADDVPGESYLRVAPRRSPGRVGVVARGNPQHPNDANRSLPRDLEAKLLSIPDATSLAPEQTGASDFRDTAEIIMGLDLVITVDTSVAHVAGALGVPVWILLPDENTDWRWMRGRDDSPWYPSAHLYRQAADRDWRPVVDRVLRDEAERRR